MKSHLLALIAAWIAIFTSCSSSTKDYPLADIGAKTESISLAEYHKIYYVSIEIGSDKNGDGTAEHPWQSVQFALSQISAASANHRNAIFISQGSYDNSPLRMKEYVDLCGGFEPCKWQRDIFKYQTILKGEKERRVIIAASHSKLDGFIIGFSQVRGKGAGLLCEGVSPTITNNIFTSNKTLSPIPWNPQYRHEIANDGGAIYCENGSSPIIENNIFANNSTETGRGAAIAMHSKCGGRIANNVFLNNTSGLNDPLRSSDGGAISIFDWSNPEIENNIILNNKALASNDGGGIFVALWSSPVIKNNILVGNECGDDGGALFVGGQEHRYNRPLDPLPSQEDFLIKITDNTLIGNNNQYRNSGAMRLTMETRCVFDQNILAHNSGIHFQRSEVTITNNIILDNFKVSETKQGLNPCIIKDNIIWGDFNLETNATVIGNNLRNNLAIDGNNSSTVKFIDDWIEINAESACYHPKKYVTSLLFSNGSFKTNELVNRVIKAENQWGVIKSNDENKVEIWGKLAGKVKFTVLPTYQLK